MRFLILKPSSLGDVVHAMPVLRLLRQARPDSEIFWWIRSDLAGLFDEDPDLTAPVIFQRHGWERPARWRDAFRRVIWLRARRFDVVLDLQSLARSGALAWLTNGAFTVGLDDAREGARGFYDVAVRRTSFRTHAVDWYLETLRVLQTPVHRHFEWIPPRPRAAAHVQAKAGERPFIVLQPGARWLTKRWPLEHFVCVTRQLAAQWPELSFAVMGGVAERDMARTLAASAPGRMLNLAGKTSLPEMIEWIRRARLMITNDTGPMHVAAAVGTPVVAVFGPTEPARTGPYGEGHVIFRRHDLPCVPCFQGRCRLRDPFACLRGLPPEPVIEAASAILRAPRQPLQSA